MTLSNTSSGVRVNWTKNTAADGYYVYRKTASGSWTRIAKVTNNLTVTYIDKTATNGVTYYYTVKAYQGSDMSGYVTNKSIKYTK